MAEPPPAGPRRLPSLDDAVRCRIRVAGTVEPRLSVRLGGLRLRAVARPGGATTVLCGDLHDQAALLGVLNGLYQFGFSLLSVDCVAATRPRRERAGAP
jgi:hypothetical protein